MGKKLGFILLHFLCVYCIFASDYQVFRYENAKTGKYEYIDVFYIEDQTESGKHFITEYYLVGYYNGQQVKLGNFTFEQTENSCFLVIYGANNDVFRRTKISGNLYNRPFLEGNTEVFGFTKETLNRPLNPKCLFYHRKNLTIGTDSFWPIALDFENDTICEFGRDWD